jgi:hypothetical protein
MVYMHNTMQKQLDELTAENIRMSKNHKVINDANTVLKTKLLAANAENLDLKEKVNPSTSEIPVLEKKLQAYEDKHFAKSQRNRCFASTFTFFGFLFWAAFWLFSEMPFCVLGAWLMLFLVSTRPFWMEDLELIATGLLLYLGPGG